MPVLVHQTSQKMIGRAAKNSTALKADAPTFMVQRHHDLLEQRRVPEGGHDFRPGLLCVSDLSYVNAWPDHRQKGRRGEGHLIGETSRLPELRIQHIDELSPIACMQIEEAPRRTRWRLAR